MFTKVLVANRGEIAIRVMRTLDEMGVGIVAVYSEADRDAPHVRRADEAYLLGPGPAAESYLVVDKIIEVAKQAGAEAIHPGYGFLAENAAFARACDENGIVFIGPPAERDRRHGLEDQRPRDHEGRRRADRPGHHRPGRDGRGRPQDHRRVDRLPGRDQGRRRRRRQGLPRRRSRSRAREGVRGRRARGREVLLRRRPSTSSATCPTRATSRSRCWPTRTATSSTSVERDCSVQRRHQKLIEESPAPAVDDELRERIGKIGTEAAKAVGYRSAGTIEGLLAGRRVLLPRDEHARAGRALRDRDGHRHRHRARADQDRGRRAAGVQAGRRRARAATRSSAASTPRTPPRTSPPPPARSPPTASRPARACASTRASRRATRSRRCTTR